MREATERISDDYLLLNSCGIEYINTVDANLLREHGRCDWHILYIHQGRCYVELDSKNIDVSAGDMVFFKPYERQKYTFKKRDDTISCFLHFTGNGCEKLVDSIFKDNKRVITVGKSNTIKGIFEKMSNEYILKKPCFEGMCIAYLLEFFYITARKLSLPKNTNTNTLVIDDVLLHMNEIYNLNKSLDYYAKYCNLSVSRFSHLFKEIVGISPTEYLINLRIDKAKELLAKTNLSVYEIAMTTGFGNQNYFSRMFKNKTGLSPTKYKDGDGI